MIDRSIDWSIVQLRRLQIIKQGRLCIGFAYGWHWEQHMGLIQVGVSEAQPRKTKSSESVGAAGRPGPADPTDPTMGQHYVH
jgi:hypothetical protein